MPVLTMARVPRLLMGICLDGNVLNLAIAKLLPATWQAFAYVDVGTEFDSLTWPQDTLRLLSDNAFDVVQPFSHAVHLNAGGNTTRIWTGFGYNFVRGLAIETSSESADFWYPGLAWAYGRRVWESAGGRFYEEDIDGQFDRIQAWSLLGHGSKEDTNATATTRPLTALQASEAHRHSISDYAARWQHTNARVAYVPGVVRQIGLLVPTRIFASHGSSHGHPHARLVAFDPQKGLHRSSEGVLYPSLTVANDIFATAV